MSGRVGRGARRALEIGGALIAILLLLLVAAVLVVTNTPWGHERTRRIALAALGSAAHGSVHIGRVDGDLLHSVILSDVSITDSAGQPFVIARQMAAHYSLLDLLHRRIDLNGVRLDHPVVVLAQTSDGRWNYSRIFPPSGGKSDTSARGWGSWLSFTNVDVVDGDLTVRAPWHLDSALTGPARDSAIRAALAPDARVVVTTVPGGYEKTVAAHAVTGRIAALRLADPEHPVKFARVASLSADLAAFRPPHATVRNVVGTFYFNGDSLWFSRAAVALPASRLAGEGVYPFETGDLRLRLQASPVALADVRFLIPRLPADGAARAGVAVTWRGRSQDYVARQLDLRTGGARATGDFGVTMGSAVIFHDTDLRFSGVETSLIEELSPGLKLPRQGIASGRAMLAGGMDALTMDADVTFDDRVAGRSRVRAVGLVGLGSGFRARRLALTLDPLQVALAAGAGTTLPIGGTITGHATVDGSTDDSLSATADLVHRQGSAYSHLVATGDVAFTPPTPATSPDRARALTVVTAPQAAAGRASTRTPTPPPPPPSTLRDRVTRVNVAARADPLDLALADAIAPSAKLSGRVTGDLHVRGDLHDLAIQSRFGAVGAADSSVLHVDGHVDVASSTPSYDLTASAHDFDVHGLMPRVPLTAITATVTARGRGTAPATMTAAVAADVGPSTYDSVALDTAHVRVSVGDGLVRVDTAHARALATTADVHGTIGLDAHHDGELTYRIAIDSLHALRRFLPPDTTTVAPRPRAVAEAVARARADSALQAQSNDVERAILGQAPQPLVVDSPPTLRRDTLIGSALATGTVRGTIQRFDLHGDLVADSVVALGNAARRVRATYQWTGGPSLQAPASATIQLDSASLRGFELDSLDARLSYEQPGGSLRLHVREDSARQYTVNALFRYTPSEKEISYDTLALQFDTTRWRATRPGSIQWGVGGLVIHHVELAAGRAGRINIDGSLPTHPGVNANLQATLHDVEVADLATLAEEDEEVQGRLSVQARVTGTTTSPRLRGSASLSSASIDRLSLPNVYMIFGYDTATLDARVELAPKGAPSAPFALATATVPIDLAIGVTGSRLPDRPLRADIKLDSLPLDLIPEFVESVRDVGGRVVGHIAVAGTVRRPDPRGSLTIADGSVTVVPTGTALRQIAGHIDLARDSATIDSLVAHTPSTGGWLRMAGVVDRTDPAVPVLNVAVTANRARVLSTRERGRVDVDANLTLAGPTVSSFLSGNTTVRSAVLYLPEPDGKRLINLGDPALYYIADTSKSAIRQLIPASASLLEHTRLDVDITVNRDSWVRNKDANVETFTSTPITLSVNRQRKALIVDGTLTTDRGDYTFMGKRFTINKGTATFIGTPELNPSLQAQGEYDVPVPGREALAIQINIGGSLDSLRLSLSSNAEPPIPQSDLLSYLAFSRSSGGVTQPASGALAGTSATGGVVGTASTFVQDQLAGQAMGVLTDQVKGDLARALGADVLAITTGDVYTDIGQNHSGAAFFQNTQIEFGKYFSPQTFVALQASVAPGGQVVHRIGNNTTLQFSGQPLYLLGAPTLSTTPNTPLTAVFGLSLSRTWRF